MLRALARWRPHHLLLAWIGWWLALALVALGPALPLLWRMQREPDLKGEAQANMTNGILSASLSLADGAAWSASVGVGAALAWIVVPPLLLWALWVAAVARTRRRETGIRA